MNRLRLPIVALVVGLFLAPSLAVAEEPQAPRLEFLYLGISGVPDAARAADAKRRVEGIPGVRSFEWTRERSEAKVVRVVGEAPSDAIVARLAEGGAKATMLAVTQPTLTFRTPLHCNGCAIKVKRALRQLAGVKEITISSALDSVTLVLVERQSSLDQVRRTLAEAQYPVQ